MTTKSSQNTCALPLINQTINFNPNSNSASKQHSTKYSQMSCLSREIHIIQCYCTVFTTFRCLYHSLP